mmetsp:Transcript_147448/g.257760  ORF Transcript_147448/g.257760 Transcript_147448/m.257760 type:complete len:122 (+) Transcript_147448:912-1277(+)
MLNLEPGCHLSPFFVPGPNPNPDPDPDTWPRTAPQARLHTSSRELQLLGPRGTCTRSGLGLAPSTDFVASWPFSKQLLETVLAWRWIKTAGKEAPPKNTKSGHHHPWDRSGRIRVQGSPDE